MTDNFRMKCLTVQRPILEVFSAALDSRPTSGLNVWRPILEVYSGALDPKMISRWSAWLFGDPDWDPGPDRCTGAQPDPRPTKRCPRPENKWIIILCLENRKSFLLIRWFLFRNTKKKLSENFWLTYLIAVSSI